MKRLRCCRRFTRAGGAALIELAVVTPLLALFFAAITELGWALHQHEVLTRATRDGARFAAGHAATAVGIVYLNPALVTQTRNLVVYGNPAGTGTPVLRGLAASNVAVSAPDTTHVQVHAAYPYQPLFDAVPFLGSFGLTLHSSVAMRAL